MKRLRVALGSAAVLAVVIGCQGSADKGGDKSSQSAAPKTDADLVQGTWAVAALEDNGVTYKEDDLKEVTVVISSKEIAMSIGKHEQWKATYKLNASANPKQVDGEKHLEVTTFEEKDGKKVPKTEKKSIPTRGIYQLEGDTLKVCLPTVDDGARPTEFTGKKDSKQRLMTLKRKKG